LVRQNLGLAAFALSALVLAFSAGLAVAHFQVFPYAAFRDGAKTVQVTLRQLVREPHFGVFDIDPHTDIPLDEIASRRLVPVPGAAQGSERLLIGGGLNQYLELCPGQGCVAVEVDRQGRILAAVPYRPDAIMAADITGGAFHHELVTTEPARLLRPIGVLAYEDGDILVTFQSVVGAAFPFSLGIARIAPDGTPRWYRRDFSHHWATLAPDGTLLVPMLSVGAEALTVEVNGAPQRVRCETGRPQIDGVQIVDGDGTVVRRLEITEALAASPWAALITQTTDGCDPLHVNFVDVIQPDAGPGLDPGDLVVSLRNLSAFAIVDPDSGAIKRVVRGGFLQQHAVHHLGGSRFLMFDNLGGDAEGGPSRLLELDLATGVERRVFPAPALPAPFRHAFSKVAGDIDISPDRRRALVSFSEYGRAFEVDLASGQPLMTYDNLHDLSQLDAAPADLRETASRAQLFSARYLED
jgi:hypothetical protein